MQLKLLLVFAFVALLSIGAPAPLNNNEKTIANYLRHDAEMLQELRQLGFDEHKLIKRQSEIDIDVNGAEEEGSDNKEPGFFDKAAKFVVELLQRFLKWINTENN
ncbi:unnamed protein product [Ceutorhynchus assimilis]|uniref:Uncharacterized protein n=1 Tax=Ceutorhynchus assimilis TaxID=467358 RepID=A0A9N9QL43_9CUCU|nr:unnamed protein product [Ceutorhynchus assimilis]